MSQLNLTIEMCLHDELLTSVKLIELGFGELQNLDTTNDFYYLPFQLLSSGFERLMKCHICLGYHEENGDYPNSKYLKSCGGKGGHDLLELKKSILDKYFKQNNIPVLKDDFKLLQNNEDLEHLLYLLSEFGKYSRYYNLDVITQATKPSINVMSLWQKYELEIIKENPELVEKLGSVEETQHLINYTNRQIVIKLERFARSICRQFTIGKLGEKAKIYSSIVYKFIILRDDDLGNQNYNIETSAFKNKEIKEHIRTRKDDEERENNPQYKYVKIKKSDFNGDWPFYHDEVIIESREKHWYIVTIENKDYALNGSAKGRYKIEFPYEAGMAIIGKSIHPFIEIAKGLTDK